ncbi:MAG TPA: FAD-dependent oxidoreductase [Capsulimonadaceae bacterium]|nr:FAD-dependent oxidoreductase [Capsulimonadaceae bacterium]
MPRAKTIVIVGGGVIGLCTAYYALQKGHHVTIIERGGPDHDCCSLGNAGMVVPSHFIPLAAPGIVQTGLSMMLHADSPFSIRPRLDSGLMRWGWLFARACTGQHVERSAPLLLKLNLASRGCYEEFAEQIGGFGLVKKGLLMLVKSHEALKEEASVALRACRLGLQAELLTAEEASDLDRGIRMDIAGAVYFPLDCHLIPQDFVAKLTQSLQSMGVEFRWQTEVTGWRAKDGAIAAVQTSTGEISADEYVLAAGSWSEETVRKLGLRLPLQAGKGYSVTMPNPRQMPTLCSILTEARVAVTPMGSALRFGGTMEIGNRDTTINQARVRGIFKSIPSYFPNFTAEDFKDLPVWSGMRPCSPDGLPYIGRFEKYSNLSAATGHAMMGVSLGPITGRLMADILSDETPQIDIAGLSPNRYR